ncbi:MAG: mandelate racemase [Proteobacteria bacterium]|jgi:L-alanine-DL-glutamate epimerase-like enolase superfamily enzyme|nr:mandelate racemase [Pseudomonadota bacterium]
MSTIRRITLQSYTYPVPDPGTAIATQKRAGQVELSRFIVSIDTDDGHTGVYAPHYGATGHALAQIREMAPALIGRNAEHREQIFEYLKNRFRHFDKVGIASLDTALWDLAGKKYGASVSQLLGGYRNKLPVYASTTPGNKTPGGLDSIESYADFAEDCKARGIPAFKIHSFFDGNVKSEIGIMTAVRERVGDEMKLMTDPASSLRSFMDAVEVGRACDDLGFFWYEDPYRDASSSAVAHKRLRDFIRTPMLIAEHIRGFEQKADFVLAGGTDILHIDPELDGGITGTMKLAHFCDAIGMEIQLHTSGPMHRHCMAAIVNTHFYELALVRPNAWNTFQPPIYADTYGDQMDDVDSDGCVPVPEGPGLGVTYDWDRINHWETAREVYE